MASTPRPSFEPIRLYRTPTSGHSHRVELFLSLLGLPVTLIDVDMRAGVHKTPDFLAKNPFGQVPVIEDGDVTLADSNAILTYLALKYDPTGRWFPLEPLAAARVQRWLSVAAGQLAYGAAQARLATVFHAPVDRPKAEAIANKLLQIMERSLTTEPFLAGAEPTVADIALYTYTATAPEGGISLAPYGQVRAWLARIEGLPRFVPMAKAL